MVYKDKPTSVTHDMQRFGLLWAKGLSVPVIATELKIPSATIVKRTLAQARELLEVGETGLALYAVTNWLPEVDRPEWVAHAAELRQQLSARLPGIRPNEAMVLRRKLLATLLADSAHCDKDDAELAALMRELHNITMTPVNVGTDIRHLRDCITPDERRVVAVTIYLSPFPELTPKKKQ